MCRARFSLLVIVLVSLFLSISGLLSITEASSCVFIESSVCSLHFKLSTPGVGEMISQFGSWTGSVTTSDQAGGSGSCTLSAAGLQISPSDSTPPRANVVCSFTIQDGTVIDAIPLGQAFNNAVIPAIAYSSSALVFKPSTTTCTTYGSYDACAGSLELNGNLFPFNIQTTSEITVQACYSANGGLLSGITSQLTNDIDALVKIYTISSTQVDLMSVRCPILATKHSIAPYFHVVKNNVKIYQANSIVSTDGISVSFLPICSLPSSSMCIIVFGISKDFPDVSDFTVHIRNFFYYSLSTPNEETCALVPPANLPNDPSKVYRCQFYRKPFSALDWQPNPFVSAINPTIQDPVVNFVFSGQFFLGNVIKFDTTDSGIEFTKPIIGPTWDLASTCKAGANSPVCVATFTSLYSGPQVTIRMKSIPFSGYIDHVYCPDVPSVTSVFNVDEYHTFTISNNGRIVQLTDTTTPFTCKVAYYLGVGQEKSYTAATAMEFQQYRENSSGVTVIYNSFNPVSFPRLFDSTGVTFTTIPLHWTPEDDCVDKDKVYCTIHLFVDFDEANPYNYMRSFDVQFPGINIDETFNNKDYTIDIRGFKGTVSDILTVEVTATPDTTDAAHKVPYFRIQVSQPDIIAAFYKPLKSGIKLGQLLYRDYADEAAQTGTTVDPEPLRHTITIKYRKAIEVGIPDEDDPTIGELNHPQTGHLRLWRYNGIDVENTQTHQPVSFQTPLQYQFYPALSVTFGPECIDPAQALCRLRFIRRDSARQIFYTSEHSFFTVVMPSFDWLVPEDLRFQGRDFENNLITFYRIPIDLLASDQFVGKPDIAMMLPKSYGTSIVYLMELIEFDIPIPPTGTTSAPYPKMINFYSYSQYIIFSRGLSVKWGEDCSTHRDNVCSISWTFDGPVMLRTYANYQTDPKLTILLEHTVPNYFVPPAINTSDLSTLPATIMARLKMDWKYSSDVYLREQATPITCDNTSNYFYSSFSSKDNPPVLWDNVVPYLSGGALTTDPPIMFIEWSTDPATGLPTMRFVTFVLAAPTVLASTTNPYTSGFTCRTTISKYWQPQPSRAITTAPINAFGWSVKLREIVTKIHVPPMRYTPITVYPQDDCVNSWKTGKLQCTAQLDIQASEEWPIYDFSVVLLNDSFSNPLLRKNGQMYLFTEPISKENEMEFLNGPKHVGTFHYRPNDALQGLVVFVINKEFRRRQITAHLVFTDNEVGTANDFLLKPGTSITGPLMVAMTPNLSRTQNPVPVIPGDTGFTCHSSPSVEGPGSLLEDSAEQVLACATEAVIYHRTSLTGVSVPYVGFPTSVSNLRQTVFLAMPSAFSGPSISVRTNMTRTTKSKVMFEYFFAVPIATPGIQIGTDLGTDRPLPCLVPVNPVDWNNPEITAESYDAIVGSLDQTLLTDFSYDLLKKTTTLPTTDLKVHGWIIPPTYTAEYHASEAPAARRTDWLTQRPGLNNNSKFILSETAVYQFSPTESFIASIPNSCIFWTQYSSAYPTIVNEVPHIYKPVGDFELTNRTTSDIYYWYSPTRDTTSRITLPMYTNPAITTDDPSLDQTTSLSFTTSLVFPAFLWIIATFSLLHF